MPAAIATRRSILRAATRTISVHTAAARDCGTFRVTRLKEPDKIDRLQTGFLNFLERTAGGRLFHCRYCRVQFYDRRMLASEDKTPELPPRQQAAASSPDHASSDV
jgi:hypothetical protein